MLTKSSIYGDRIKDLWMMAEGTEEKKSLEGVGNAEIRNLGVATWLVEGTSLTKLGTLFI